MCCLLCLLFPSALSCLTFLPLYPLLFLKEEIPNFQGIFFSFVFKKNMKISDICISVLKVIFNNLAFWAGSVIELPCTSVCVSVKLCVYLYKIKSVCMILRILNLDRHQNCMISSKFTTTLTTFFGSGTSLLRITQLCPISRVFQTCKF